MDATQQSDAPETPVDLAELRRRLEQAEQLLACFQQVAGHELPNHLIAIEGLVRVLELEEKDHLRPQSRDYLQRLSGVAQRAHSLVSSLAEIGRARRDRQTPEVLSLAEVAREAAAEINQLFPGRPIEYHFPESTATLLVPRPGLRRVLVQLLRNAILAAVDGRPLHVEVGFRQASSGLELWLTDNGCGLTPERLVQLRQFFSCRTDAGASLDLGWVLVRQCVDHWGGSVRVDSEQGRGTTVCVRLHQ